VRDLGRWAAWLAGLWAGMLATIAAMAAPSAFVVLERADAGRFVSRVFAQEAYASVAIVAALIAAERFASRRRGSSPFSAEMLMLLGALFCTVAGWFAIQPMMAEARAGQGAWSFAALHAVSSGFFALKTLLAATVAFRLNRRPS
jgi:hypothetical protein